MKILMASAILATSVAAGAGLVAMPTNASAQSFELQIGPDGVQVRDPRERDRYERRDRGGCNPDHARSIARDEGLRRARVVDVTPRRVVVEGQTRRGFDNITFANRRGCPIIG